jgi:alpha,alpha-trehalase
MWDKEKALWLDFNITSSNTSSKEFFSIASWIPLWAGLSDDADSDNIVNSLINSQLLQPGGVLTTSIYTGQQWDSPNSWAPLVLMTIQGLRSIHSKMAKDLSVIDIMHISHS